ncbi:hypothetical protein BDP27DRAFT_1433215 [Rhodocollybia butyracea]|uniref:Uncharacterized protein n=1 Tax=Rhodocollybia butyracea TaxID=206335 RepID=A0A9P5TYC5_9AGAR|nr:hypothetical protein BDP27DRAFT_1433215 [Rhodocollybia butyracea]
MSASSSEMKNSKDSRYYQQNLELRREQSRIYQQKKRDCKKYSKAHGIPNTETLPRKRRTERTNGSSLAPVYVDKGVQVDAPPTLALYRRLTDLRAWFDEWSDGGTERWKGYTTLYPPMQNHLRYGVHLVKECYQMFEVSLPNKHLDLVSFYNSITNIAYSIGRLRSQIFLKYSVSGINCVITPPDLTPPSSVFYIENLDDLTTKFYKKRYLPIHGDTKHFISSWSTLGMDPGPKPGRFGTKKLCMYASTGHFLYQRWRFLLEKAGNVFTDERFTRSVFKEGTCCVYLVGETISRLEVAADVVRS